MANHGNSKYPVFFFQKWGFSHGHVGFSWWVTGTSEGRRQQFLSRSSWRQDFVRRLRDSGIMRSPLSWASWISVIWSGFDLFILNKFQKANIMIKQWPTRCHQPLRSLWLNCGIEDLLRNFEWLKCWVRRIVSPCFVMAHRVCWVFLGMLGILGLSGLPGLLQFTSLICKKTYWSCGRTSSALVGNSLKRGRKTSHTIAKLIYFWESPIHKWAMLIPTEQFLI